MRGGRLSGTVGVEARELLVRSLAQNLRPRFRVRRRDREPEDCTSFVGIDPGRADHLGANTGPLQPLALAVEKSESTLGEDRVLCVGGGHAEGGGVESGSSPEALGGLSSGASLSTRCRSKSGPWNMRKTKVSPRIPKILKFIHVDVLV